MMMNNCSVRKMYRIDYLNKLRKKSASCWFLLNKYITMHVPENAKNVNDTGLGGC
jgi:hypothetical protein